VSPVGTKKAYPVYLDETAELWDSIAVSAGIRGRQMLLAPADLARITAATPAAIASF
jgi:Cys-tRNA(Pro)/Cys-tRNA(Cys) deacylase